MDENQVEVDELFGDGRTLGDAVTLNLSPGGISAEGNSRCVDDLHRSLSEQRVAWSGSGYIAVVGSDPHTVCISYLVYARSDGKWQLGKEHVIHLGMDGDTKHPVLRLEWSPSGYDLALADAAGRVAIVNVSGMALNETMVSRPLTHDREDELCQVLCFRWLNIDRPQFVTYVHAAKDEGKWKYEAALRRPRGPYRPRAVVAITRRGSLVLHYQGPDAQWTTARTDLRTVSAAGYLLTHAAVAPTRDNKLLVTVQDSNRRISVYLATISMPDPKHEHSIATEIKISVNNIKASVPYQRAKDSKDTKDQDEESTLFGMSSKYLSHLQIIPTSDVEKSEQLPPTILAFYTPVINTFGMVCEGQLAVTTVKRWYVKFEECKLHPTFDAMPCTAIDNKVGQVASLQRLHDVHIDHIITIVQKLDGGEQLALGSIDGSLMFYEPNTLVPLYTSQDFAQINSLSQAGFVFPAFPRGADSSLSPNGCVAASLANDSSIEVTHLVHPEELAFGSLDPAVVEAAVVAIVLSFSRSVYLSTSTNDIMLLVNQQVSSAHYPQLVQSILKNLLGDGDFMPIPEISQYISKPTVARALSLAASLGHDLATGQRTRTSMLSWLSLHIRSCTSTSMRILLSINQNGGADWSDADVCDLVCNNIRWALDLCKFIVDELFEMDDLRTANSDPETVPHHITEAQGIVSLLLVSVWPRSLLRMIPRILRGFVRVTQAPKTPLSPDAAPAFARMAELVESSSLKMEPLEHLLAGADKVVQQFFDISGMSVSEKADAERFILSHGQIPEVLQDAVPKILQNVLPTQREKMDRLSLYTNNYAWLGIQEDSKTRAFKRDHVVDVHRKAVFSKRALGRVRRCVRCGSISTDLVRVRRWPQYLQNVMLRCICEDSFVVVAAEDL